MSTLAGASLEKKERKKEQSKFHYFSPPPPNTHPPLSRAPSLTAIMAVGVLALQGSYNEHIAALRRIGVKGVEIRKPEQLRGIDSLIIPGGESTTMAKLAELHNLFPALREFVGSGKPVWGTCAGLIFLADKAIGQKTGGQELVGGLDCTVHRNFFGSQLQSFETELSVPKLAEKEGGTDTCRGVFIRAPAILEVGPNVEVIANCPLSSDRPKVMIPSADGQEEREFKEDRVIVAVKQRNLLATAFHPELTSDSRWHRYFLAMVEEAKEEAAASEAVVKYDLYANANDSDAVGKRALDLPIFE